MTDAQATRLIRVFGVAFVAGALVMPVALWIRFTGDAQLGYRLIMLSSLGLILGFSFVGAMAPYLAGRSSGISFTQVVRSPFRWMRGARAVRAFAQVQHFEGVTWTEFATAVQLGVDAEQLARAIEHRKAMGYPIDIQALLAALLVGVDPEVAARSKDVYAAITRGLEKQSAESAA